ncbi:DUF5047 domain-containing protein [Labedaea rhizosphaerae]|uniref:Uncharacterized protein DUF5047 n=1 Tax=Labedaea rhizosphaerae TaxID=598644 RepID=A0A4R6SDE1_LABRH|nr:DUF5047 domain-containing protein [Labedaea rhizosphaerae]TDP97643.1 uncharacterized protein DUF5047 [Labedaea rhizosphaerae]
MRPVSARFLDALTGSHAAPSRVTLCAPNQIGVAPAGVPLALTGGDVKVDVTAVVRSTLDITVQEPWEQDVTGALNPYGAEVFAERGIRYADGSTEWVGLGYFRLYEVSQDDAPQGQLHLTGQDRMSALVDARVTQPRQFDTSASVGLIFDTLIGEVLPGVSVAYDFAAYSTTFPTSHVLEEDRQAFLQDIADALGKQFYAGYDGRFYLVDAPSLADPPVWTVKEGAGGVLVKASRSRSRSGVYNAVVATGDQASDTTASVRGIALDLNVASPTYWFGPYGQVPRFYSSSFIVTQAQADAAATAMLQKSIGLPSTMDFQSIVNPALEGGDVVGLEYEADTPTRNYILDTFTVPLVPGSAMSATTRQQFGGDDG